MDKVTIYNLLGTCFKVWSSPVEGFGLCDSSTEEICFEIRLSVIAKDMDGLPDSTISTVLTFLDFKETHRCACINKEWKLHVRKKLERLREKAAQKRAQMTVEEKKRVDEKLFHAGEQGNLADVQMLLAAGADVLGTNCDGFTALMLATFGAHYRIVEVLLASGACVNASNSLHSTALMMAAFIDNARIVEVLLAAGANCDAKNNDGWTALMMAARFGHLEVVQVLLGVGADVERIDNDGLTALMMAASRGYSQIVEELLSYGADRNVANNHGETALSLAERHGHEGTALMLMDAGAED